MFDKLVGESSNLDEECVLCDFRWTWNCRIYRDS
jgi:hypothetical protein